MKLSSVATPDRCAPRVSWPRGASRLARSAYDWVLDTLARPSVMSLFDQAVVSGTSFVTTVCVGRMCSKGELGVYYLALSIFFFARGVQEQTIVTPYTVYCSRRRGRELATYSASSLAHQLVLSLVSVLFLLTIAGLISLGVGPTRLAPVVWILLGAVPLLLLREFIRQFSFAHLQQPVAIAIDVTVAALQLATLGLLAYFGVLSVPTVFAVMGGACAVACIGWLLLKKHPLRFESIRILADWWQNWTLAKWALAGELVGYSAPYVMPWIVVAACGEAATGMLAACATLIGLSNTFIMGMSNFLAPKAARTFAAEGSQALEHLLIKAAVMFAITLGTFALLVAITGNQAAVFVYGSDYAGAGLIMTIYAVEMLVLSMGVTAAAGLWAIERPSANFAADASTMIVTLGAAVCLVVPLGIAGAALASLMGTTAGTLVRCLTFIRVNASNRLDPIPLSQ